MKVKNLQIQEIVYLVALFIALLLMRRFDQVLHPDVWTEDGAFNITSYIHLGWANLLEPVQGYLITISKLITDTSLWISFMYYPEISTILAWLFTIFVSLVIVYAPTVLPYRIVAAVMIYMVPAYGEPYGIPLFTFWFAGLFVLLVLLWKQGEHLVFKNILLVIGGLSSPVIVVAIPAQIYRLFIFKEKKEELTSLFIMFFLAAVQLLTMMHTGAVDASDKVSFTALLSHIHISDYITFFFGKYYMGAFLMDDYSKWITNDYYLMYAGGVFFLCIIAVYFYINRKDPYPYIFLYLLFAMLAIVLYRVGFEVARLSPRYFFYVSIMQSWLLLYMMRGLPLLRYIIVPILIFSVITALGIYSKKSDTLKWHTHVLECRDSSELLYSIPIHYAGWKEDTWHISIKPETCQKLLANDMLYTEVKK